MSRILYTVDSVGVRLPTADGAQPVLRDISFDVRAGEIVAIRNRTVAHLAYNLDDRNGYQPGLVCRVVRAASTFHWNRPKT